MKNQTSNRGLGYSDKTQQSNSQTIDSQKAIQDPNKENIEKSSQQTLGNKNEDKLAGNSKAQINKGGSSNINKSTSYERKIDDQDNSQQKTQVNSSDVEKLNNKTDAVNNQAAAPQEEINQPSFGSKSNTQQQSQTAPNNNNTSTLNYKGNSLEQSNLEASQQSLHESDTQAKPDSLKFKSGSESKKGSNEKLEQQFQDSNQGGNFLQKFDMGQLNSNKESVQDPSADFADPYGSFQSQKNGGKAGVNMKSDIVHQSLDKYSSYLKDIPQKLGLKGTQYKKQGSGQEKDKPDFTNKSYDQESFKENLGAANQGNSSPYYGTGDSGYSAYEEQSKAMGSTEKLHFDHSNQQLAADDSMDYKKASKSPEQKIANTQLGQDLVVDDSRLQPQKQEVKNVSQGSLSKKSEPQIYYNEQIKPQTYAVSGVNTQGSSSTQSSLKGQDPTNQNSVQQQGPYQGQVKKSTQSQSPQVQSMNGGAYGEIQSQQYLKQQQQGGSTYYNNAQPQVPWQNQEKSGQMVSPRYQQNPQVFQGQTNKQAYPQEQNLGQSQAQANPYPYNSQTSYQNEPNQYTNEYGNEADQFVGNPTQQFVNNSSQMQSSNYMSYSNRSPTFNNSYQSGGQQPENPTPSQPYYGGDAQYNKPLPNNPQYSNPQQQQQNIPSQYQQPKTLPQNPPSNTMQYPQNPVPYESQINEQYSGMPQGQYQPPSYNQNVPLSQEHVPPVVEQQKDMDPEMQMYKEQHIQVEQQVSLIQHGELDFKASSMLVHLSLDEDQKHLQDHLKVIEEMKRNAKNLKTKPNIVVDKLIAKGGFSNVYRGSWQGIQVAIKTILFEDDTGGKLTRKQQAIHETAITTSMIHPNVVQCIFYNIEKLNHNPGMPNTSLIQKKLPDLSQDIYKIYLVQEFCESGNLSDALTNKQLWDSSNNRPNLAQVTLTALDIARGMQHIHNKNIIHGDLKTSNVLLRQLDSPNPYTYVAKPQSNQGGEVSMRNDKLQQSFRFLAKIADFGLSVKMYGGQNSISNFHAGTPFYAAPEILDSGKLSKNSDVYSFGVILWELYHHQKPYVVQNVNAVTQFKSQTNFPRFTMSCPFQYALLCGICLSQDPTDRPSFQQIIEILEGMYLKIIANEISVGKHNVEIVKNFQQNEQSLERNEALVVLQQMLEIPNSSDTPAASRQSKQSSQSWAEKLAQINLKASSSGPMFQVNPQIMEAHHADLNSDFPAQFHINPKSLERVAETHETSSQSSNRGQPGGKNYQEQGITQFSLASVNSQSEAYNAGEHQLENQYLSHQQLIQQHHHDHVHHGHQGYGHKDYSDKAQQNYGGQQHAPQHHADQYHHDALVVQVDQDGLVQNMQHSYESPDKQSTNYYMPLQAHQYQDPNKNYHASQQQSPYQHSEEGTTPNSFSYDHSQPNSDRVSTQVTSQANSNPYISRSSIPTNPSINQSQQGQGYGGQAYNSMGQPIRDPESQNFRSSGYEQEPTPPSQQYSQPQQQNQYGSQGYASQMYENRPAQNTRDLPYQPPQSQAPGPVPQMQQDPYKPGPPQQNPTKPQAPNQGGRSGQYPQQQQQQYKQPSPGKQQSQDPNRGQQIPSQVSNKSQNSESTVSDYKVQPGQISKQILKPSKKMQELKQRQIELQREQLRLQQEHLALEQEHHMELYREQEARLLQQQNELDSINMQYNSQEQGQMQILQKGLQQDSSLKKDIPKDVLNKVQKGTQNLQLNEDTINQLNASQGMQQKNPNYSPAQANQPTLQGNKYPNQSSAMYGQPPPDQYNQQYNQYPNQAQERGGNQRMQQQQPYQQQGQGQYYQGQGQTPDVKQKMFQPGQNDSYNSQMGGNYRGNIQESMPDYSQASQNSQNSMMSSQYAPNSGDNVNQRSGRPQGNTDNYQRTLKPVNTQAQPSSTQSNLSQEYQAVPTNQNVQQYNIPQMAPQSQGYQKVAPPPQNPKIDQSQQVLSKGMPQTMYQQSMPQPQYGQAPIGQEQTQYGGYQGQNKGSIPGQSRPMGGPPQQVQPPVSKQPDYNQTYNQAYNQITSNLISQNQLPQPIPQKNFNQQSTGYYNEPPGPKQTGPPQMQNQQRQTTPNPGMQAQPQPQQFGQPSQMQNPINQGPGQLQPGKPGIGQNPQGGQQQQYLGGNVLRGPPEQMGRNQGRKEEYQTYGAMHHDHDDGSDDAFHSVTDEHDQQGHQKYQQFQGYQQPMQSNYTQQIYQDKNTYNTQGTFQPSVEKGRQPNDPRQQNQPKKTYQNRN